MTNKLNELREKIDDLDQKILHLINERAKLALAVGFFKQTTDIEYFYRPEREAQILDKLIKQNPGPFTSKEISAIFRPLLTACLKLQQPIKIAFLGPEGTYSEAALYKHFGAEAITHKVASIAEVFKVVEMKEANYGVVPIENSTTGIINNTLDNLMASSLRICGEIILPIQHCLLSRVLDIKAIKKIYAHEQSLMQCQAWLRKNMPWADLIALESNGAAAKRASENSDSGAIAGELAASMYDLKLLVSNIQDKVLNETRFLILGEQKVTPSGEDKTSLLIATPHTPGSLFELLKPFVDQHINICSIESRPYHHRNWSYLFFIDIEGHEEDLPVKTALADLAKKANMLNILGSYPKAIV